MVLKKTLSGLSAPVLRRRRQKKTRRTAITVRRGNVSPTLTLRPPPDALA